MANFDLSKSRRSTGAGAEKFAVVFGRCHDREILARQRRQREVGPAGLDRQAARGAVVGQRDERAVGQLAHDLVQGDGRDGRRACALDLGGGVVDDLDIEVGRAEDDRVAFGLDQDVGEDRDGVAPLDHGLRLTDRLEKRAAFDAEFHALIP